MIQTPEQPTTGEQIMAYPYRNPSTVKNYQKTKITLSDGNILTITVGGDRDITIESVNPIAVIPRAVNRVKLVMLDWDEQRIHDIQ